MSEDQQSIYPIAFSTLLAALAIILIFGDDLFTQILIAALVVVAWTIVVLIIVKRQEKTTTVAEGTYVCTESGDCSEEGTNLPVIVQYK